MNFDEPACETTWSKFVDLVSVFFFFVLVSFSHSTFFQGCADFGLDPESSFRVCTFFIILFLFYASKMQYMN